MEQQGIGNIHFSSAPVAIKELKYSSTIGGEIMISGEDRMFLQISIPRDGEEVHHCYIATLLHCYILDRMFLQISSPRSATNISSAPGPDCLSRQGGHPSATLVFVPLSHFYNFYIATFPHCYIPDRRLLEWSLYPCIVV